MTTSIMPGSIETTLPAFLSRSARSLLVRVQWTHFRNASNVCSAFGKFGGNLTESRA